MKQPLLAYPSRRVARSRQRGLSLAAGMIMLVLISLLVSSAYVLSTTNSKAVANMQFRDEVIAASNRCIEGTIATTFVDGFTTLPTAATTCPVDINNDGTADYSISVSVPVCAQASQVSFSPTGSGAGSLTSNSLASTTPDPYWATVWELVASVTDTVSGASMEIHQGVRVNLTLTQKSAVCS